MGLCSGLMNNHTTGICQGWYTVQMEIIEALMGIVNAVVGLLNGILNLIEQLFGPVIQLVERWNTIFG